MNTRTSLLLILLLGMMLRFGLLIFFWDQPLTIVDEQHYQAIAENILDNHEFALKKGHPTAIRPPLYPAFLSVIYFMTGGIHFNAVRIVQIFLSLGIIYMVFTLGKQMFDDATGLLAAFLFAVYPSFLFFTHFLLTEVLFTFLFLLFIFFFISALDVFNSNHQSSSPYAPRPMRSALCPLPPSHPPTFPPSFYSQSPLPSALCIFLAGLFLGLGALTRSILYPFLPLAIVFLFFAFRGALIKKIKGIFLFAIGFVIVISPWTVRNHFLFNDFVPIGTMGGLNLYMGNYAHTPSNRAWAAVDLAGDKAWYYGHEKVLMGMNEAQKQKWAIKKAKTFILDHKLLTLKRDLVKAANFWGLERTIIGCILNNFWPSLNKTMYIISITAAIFLTYSMVITGSIFGFIYSLQPGKWDVQLVFLLIIYFTGMHAIVFGHSRYHLSLIPILMVFSSHFFLRIKEIWHGRRSLKFRLSLVPISIFFMIWIREIVFVERYRYLSRF